MQPVQLPMSPININVRHEQTNEHESNSIRPLPLQYQRTEFLPVQP